MRHHSFPILGMLVAALVLTPALAAHARVGVTSETNGDPTGKPPVDAERILRVGIDIQADEMITTRENDRAHIVFLDGTSLTVAPQAQLKIDRFVYDPTTKTGDIAITVAKGVFRVVGGRISKSNDIKINTPSATIGIRGGIALFDVGAQETKSQFLFGNFMSVSAHGRTETARRPGSEIRTRFGGFPGVPGVIAVGGVGPTLLILEGRPGTGGDRTPDTRARQSGFSDHNSGKGVTSPRPNDLGGRIPGAATDAVSNANAQKIQPTFSPPVAAIPPPVIPNDPWCNDNRSHHRRHRH